MTGRLVYRAVGVYNTLFFRLALKYSDLVPVCVVMTPFQSSLLYALGTDRKMRLSSSLTPSTLALACDAMRSADSLRLLSVR